jgi:hypothetical protein
VPQHLRIYPEAFDLAQDLGPGLNLVVSLRLLDVDRHAAPMLA